MSPRSNRKNSTWSAVNSKKNTWRRWVVELSPRYGHVVLVSGYLVLTGVNWSKEECPISKKYTVNEDCMSLPTYYLEYGRHVARLHRHRCRRRRAYASTSNTAVHDNHEKIHTWVSFCYMVMGLRLVVLRAAGAPLLKLYFNWRTLKHQPKRLERNIKKIVSVKPLSH